MSKQFLVGAIAGVIAVTAAGALGYQKFGRDQFATVTDVKATSKTIAVPREECHDETVTRVRDAKDTHQIAGTVVGAVVGGVIGNQIGSGRGQTIARIGGAAAGGYAGNRVQKGIQERNTYEETKHVCKTVHDKQQQPTGYDVSYRLDGEEKLVHLDYDPGKQIPVVDGQLVLEKK
jgi:uncharacterized protein YcfJ